MLGRAQSLLAATGPRPKPARQPEHALPQCHFAFDPVLQTIVGAFSVSECCVLQHGALCSEAFWKADRFVECLPHLSVPREAKQWCSTLIHLLPDFEMHARMQPVSVGGALKDHFLELAGQRWFLCPLDAAQLQTLGGIGSSGLPVTLVSQVKYARAAKVVPTVVRTRADRE